MTPAQKVKQDSRKLEIKALAAERDRRFKEADEARSEARAEANREFVAGLKEIIDNSDETVVSAAEAIGIGRVTLHQIIKKHS